MKLLKVTKFLFSLSLIFLFFLKEILSQNPIHNWKSHSMVAKKVIETYDALNSLKANFTIQTKNKTMSGTAYYQKPGKARFEFTNPPGDILISDGKTLWIVIGNMNLVGKQDLHLEKKSENNKPIFAVFPSRGIQHLFEKYHYKFDDINQPKDIDGKKYYVLDLEQRVKIGGYEKMRIFVDANTYLIEKAIAEGSFGATTTIQFSNFNKNLELEGKLFQYTPSDNIRVVSNPLVSEE